VKKWGIGIYEGLSLHVRGRGDVWRDLDWRREADEVDIMGEINI